MRPTLSVILPTYNERGNIVNLIHDIQKTCHEIGVDHEIFVIDDNSPDGTAKKVSSAFSNKTIKVFIRTKDKGLAMAIKSGISKAQGKYILVMDTDFNHNPAEIPTMLGLIKKYPLVIGSRYVKNGGMENRLRHWLSYTFNIYLRLLLGHSTHDNLSGFFLIRRSAMKRINNDSIFHGFGDYFMRLIFHAHRKRLSIVETPVYYKNRIYGKSKSRFLHMFLSYTYSALKLRFMKT